VTRWPCATSVEDPFADHDADFVQQQMRRTSLVRALRGMVEQMAKVLLDFEVESHQQVLSYFMLFGSDDDSGNRVRCLE